MKRITLLLAFFCFSLSGIQAETVYLNSTGGCLDHFEYLVTNDKVSSSHAVFRYSPKINTNLIFDVGVENSNVLDKIPGALTSCSKIKNWNSKTIQRINSQELIVFIVKQTPQGYSVSKVNSGAYFQQKGQVVSYFNSDFDFVTDLGKFSYSRPLSSSNSKSEIILEQYGMYDCSTVLTLRQSPNSSQIPNGSFQFIPEFGMTSYAQGWDINKSKNKMQLISVNGRDFNAHLSEDCIRRGMVSTYNAAPESGKMSTRIITGSDVIPPNAIYTGHIGFDDKVEEIAYVAPVPAKTYEAPVSYEVVTKKDVVIIEEKKAIVAPQEEFTARSIPSSYEVVVEPVNPCGASTDPGYHLVQKGETLYALTRKYNVPLKQIRDWNALKEDLIHPCMSLRVSKNAAPNPAVVVNTPKSTPKTTYTPAPKPKPSPVVTPVSAPVADEFSAKGVSSAAPVKHSDMSWLSQSETHTVLAGQTMANLAARFGYTEERFRYINGMGDTQTLRVGQKIRTTDCNCVVTPQPYETTDAVIFTEKSAVATSNIAPIATEEFTSKSADMNYYSKQDVPSSFEYSANSNVQSSKVPTSYDVVSIAPNGHKVHIVKKEDTLFSLAKAYNTSIEAIMKLNNLDKGEIIIPAQRLYVK